MIDLFDRNLELQQFQKYKKIFMKFRRPAGPKTLTSTTVIATRYNWRVFWNTTRGRRDVHCRLTSITVVFVAIISRTDYFPLKWSAAPYLQYKWKKNVWMWTTTRIA